MNKAAVLLFLLACPCDSSEAPAAVPVAASVPDSPVGPAADVPWPEPDWRLTMAVYETRLPDTGPAKGRARNVRLAADLAECVLEPGDEFSFNLAVGPRVAWRGFVDAPVIVLGEMTRDVGGGVCQVSSTLHVAAIRAGLDVVERRPHSRAPVYVPAGLDAMVSWPSDCDGDCEPVDLVVSNPFDFSVGIFSSVRPGPPGTSILRVEIWGHSPVTRPSVGSVSGGRKPFRRRIREVPSLLRPRRSQKGVDGVTVLTTVRDGWVGLESFATTYRPVDEIWEVPADHAGLPPWCSSTVRSPDCDPNEGGSPP